MPDVKKLIVGFLILAAGASSSALILSNIGGANSAGQTANAGQNTAAAQTLGLGGNAFTNGASQTNPTPAISTTTDAQLTDPTNLTNALSDAFLNNLVAANPDGAQTDGSGNMLVGQPNDQAVIKQFTGSNALANLKIPNWDIEAAEQKINIKTNYSTTDLSTYAASIGNITDKYIQQTNLASILQSEDPSSASFAESNLASAVSEIANLATPAPFVSFQKSLVKLLVYEKNYAALAVNASDDPIKTQLIANAEEAKFNTAGRELDVEIQKLTAKKISANTGDNNLFSFIGGLFIPQTAHAQIFVPVSDIKQTLVNAHGHAMTVAQFILAYVRNVALQITRNLLMTLVQQKVLRWIQGSGAPRFIQNWGSTIVNSYTAAAVNILNQQFACVPQFMLPSLKILLSTPSVPGGNAACAAQFNSQLGNNLTNFYNHFENGGFNSYFSLFQPNGNAFGAIISIQDAAAAGGSNAQQATLSKTTSAQGYNGSEACSDNPLVYVQGKYLPDGSHYACQDPTGAMYRASVGAGGSVTTASSCASGQTLVQVPNGNLCANGETPQVTTPGNVTNQAMGSALDSTPKLIAGSVEITGLVAAFLQSLMNTLAQTAINYTNKVVQGALQPSDSGVAGVAPDFGSSTVQQVINNPIQEPGVVCTSDNPNPVLDSANPQEAIANYQASGGASDENGYPPTYTWSSTAGGQATGGTFSETYTAVGTYTVTVTASTDHSTSDCDVTVTNAPPAGAGATCGGTTPGTCANPTQTCTPTTIGGTTTFSCQ